MLILRNMVILASLLAISPFLIILFLVIIIEDGLPAIFIQERVGINKKIFRLLKIRTMKKNTPQAGTHDVDQSHVLRCGKIIRKFKLDEFLQLINVLRGDINLIGPRPCLENQRELVNERDRYGLFLIKPGITGLSQVCGYDMSNKKLAFVDSLYIQKKSFLLDFKILIATLTGIFRKDLKRDFSI
jgi:O-antigen biosynthesis protein WbqP